MAWLRLMSFVVFILLAVSARITLAQEDEDDYDYDDYEDYDYDEEYDYDEDYKTEGPTTRAPTTTTKTPWWLTTTLAARPTRRRTVRPTRRSEYLTPGPTVRKRVVTSRPDSGRNPNRSGDRSQTFDRSKQRYEQTTRPTRSRYTPSPIRSRYESVPRVTQRSRYNTARATATRATPRSRYESVTRATPRSRYEVATRAPPRSRYDTAARATTKSRYPTTRSRYDRATESNRRTDRRDPQTRYVGTTVPTRYQGVTPRSRYYATTRTPRYYAGRQTEAPRRTDSRYESNRSDDDDDYDVEDSGDCGCEAVQDLKSEHEKLKARLERIEKSIGDLGETVVKVELDSANWKRSLRFPGLSAIKNPSNIILKDDVISDRKYKDCQDVKRKGNERSGVYGIMPDNSAFTTFAYCQDGWTFLQRRFDGSVPFNKKYDQYVKGFGNFSSEFWLGLENMHQLTSQNSYTLRIDMETSNAKFFYAMYDNFRIGNETDGYRLYYGNMTAGNLDDGLRTTRDRPFSTYDRDRDNWSYGNCAQFYHSGFWLDRCGTDLNRIPKLGRYGGMRWDRQIVVSSLMRVKPTRDIRPNEFKLVP